MDTTTLVFVAGVWLGVTFGILGALLLRAPQRRTAYVFDSAALFPTPQPVRFAEDESFRGPDLAWLASQRAAMSVMHPKDATKVVDVL